MGDYSAVLIDKATNFIKRSHGHYDFDKLKTEMETYVNESCYVLYNEDARKFSWEWKYNRITENQKWMIDTTIKELPTTEGRMKHSVEKLIGVAQARIVKAGFTEPCTRCGGNGHYLYNQVDGTRCYGCQGRKVAMVKFTKANKIKIEQHFNMVTVTTKGDV